ncbi:MAG: hypothetical protein K9N35_01390 [Candidatus Marinimicrobia bacterium]|nr:hypothetical protein [Candidatus Neomarinimicrobiota bacterium]
MKFKISLIIILLMSLSAVNGQILAPQKFSQQTYPRSGEKFITDEFGVIRMYVNIWGQVNQPGSHLVYDGIDLVSFLSMTGGPKSGAKMNKVKIYRSEPDESGTLVYVINMKEFLKSGRRDQFIELKPNDTIIIDQTIPSYVLSHMNVVTTLMTVLNLYLQIDYRLNN